MDKIQYLKNSKHSGAGDALSRFVSGGELSAHRTNWAGNYEYGAGHLHFPRSVEEVREVVRNCAQLKALGARHSFNGIADSTENQVSLEYLDNISLDTKARTVTVDAGVTYGRLCPWLDVRGFALHNLASLPHLSVAGACATATHGSGMKNGNLSTAVSALELVTADGEITTLSHAKDGDRFAGAVVALGGLGVVTKVTLDIEPTFTMSQIVYENLSFSQLEKHLDDIFSSGYSVSLFTDWQNHRATQVWIKRRVEPGDASAPPSNFFGATLATTNLHPIPGHSAESCTEQMGVPGPWFDRLPHFRMDFTPSSGNELQTEYFVPCDQGYQAILAVERLRDRITPHLFATEFRTIDADRLWLSPCYQRSSMTLHFTWKPEWAEVQKVLPMIEERLAPFGARPHWAKLFTVPPERLQANYARLADYRALLRQYDPHGKFRNAFLDANLYGA